MLVGGITIHSLLGLSIDKNVIVSKSNSIIDIWPTIKYMIINEISMVDLQHACYNAFEVAKIEI